MKPPSELRRTSQFADPYIYSRCFGKSRAVAYKWTYMAIHGWPCCCAMAPVDAAAALSVLATSRVTSREINL